MNINKVMNNCFATAFVLTILLSASEVHADDIADEMLSTGSVVSDRHRSFLPKYLPM